MTPTLVASRTALPPEGAAAPAVWQSQSRGPGLQFPLRQWLATCDTFCAANSWVPEYKSEPRNRLRRAAGGAAPSGGRELHAVSDRGGLLNA
jgi:hypothetical protein